MAVSDGVGGAAPAAGAVVPKPLLLKLKAGGAAAAGLGGSRLRVAGQLHAHDVRTKTSQLRLLQ